MAKRDYYEVLGVSKSATADEMKKAYRKLAMEHHPDRNPGDKAAEEKFKEAAEAYDVLSTPEKKAKYDQFGHAGMGANAGYGPGGMNMDDIFAHFGDIFESAFGGSFGGGHFHQFTGGFGSSGRRQQQRRRTNRGTDLRVRVKLSLEEIQKGVEKKIKVRKKIACDTCGGTGAASRDAFKTCETCKGMGQVTRVTNTFIGQMQQTSVCPTCQGEGRIITQKCKKCNGNGVMEGEEIITIRIPAGVENGMQLSIPGKGNAAVHGGMAGDLIVLVEELEHPIFERVQHNLHYNLFVNITEAVLGESVEVPTLDGKVRVKIDAGTQSGKLLRLRGKGLPAMNSYGTGDIIICVNIWTPQSVTKEEKELLEKLRKSPNFKPNPKNQKNNKGFFDRIKDYFGG
ncbi:MAG: molecular chaperone DnaJ [Bacteroidales bacterium]|nr:molecular chaperone DnaJ [Bacteroidales bacterium]